MSEKPQQDVSRETPGEERPAPPPQKNKPSSVYIYLAVLFGAAFLMLLLAYFVQQRNNETTISGLQNSWNLSREELVEENQKLAGEKEALEAQLAQLEQDLRQEREFSYEFQVLYDGATDQAAHLNYWLTRRSEAMELFWQLDRAYTQGRRQTCVELIQLLEKNESNPLKEFLPDGDERGEYEYAHEWPSPAQRYREIYEKLS